MDAADSSSAPAGASSSPSHSSTEVAPGVVLSSSGGAHTSTDTTNPSAPADPEPTKQPAAASTTDTEPVVAESAPEPTHAVEPARKKSKRAAATPPSVSTPSVERAAATAPAESTGADTPDTAPKPDPVPEVQAASPKSISLEPVSPGKRHCGTRT